MRKTSKTRLLAAAGALLAAQAQAQSYYVTPLALQPGWYSADCGGMNARGDIVGTAVVNVFAEWGYDGFVATRAGTYSAGYSKGGLAEEPAAINSSRVVVGNVILDQTFGFRAGATWQRNGDAVQKLYAFGSDQTTASGINEAGDIVGSGTLPSHVRHAVMWTDGVPVDLAPGSRDSVAAAVNDQRQAVGQANGVPVMFADGAVMPLGTLGGSHGGAVAINASGHVVGWSELAGDQQSHAFLVVDGTMRDLGSLPGHDSQAFGINAHDVIVGNATSSTRNPVALVWRNGHMHRLDDLLDPVSGAGWHFFSASAIDDAGDICADSDAGPALLTPMP